MGDATKKVIFLSSLKMALATLISRVLGLVREQVMAFYFGASELTDAFLVAYRIPNLLRDLFAEGAFSAAFVPAFTEELLKGKQNARRLLWTLFVLLIVITGSVSCLIVFAAGQIVHLFAPSFADDPEKFGVTVTMVKLMAPFLTLVSLAAVMMGALNSLKVFFVPALAPAFFNVAMICSMFFGTGYFVSKGMPAVYALAIGAVLGGLLQALTQVPMLFARGFAPTLNLKMRDPQVKTVFKKLGPGLIGFAATQLNLIVNTILASGAGIGAVSWLSYAFRLFQFPVGILGVSVAGSNLVHFSKAWKADDKDKAIGFLQTSIFFNYLFMLPATVFLFIAGSDVIEVIFQRGKFLSSDTAQTYLALQAYAAGLFFYGLYKILVPVFYTIDRQKIPVFVSIFAIGFNIVFCVSLVDQYGFAILAIGTTISMFLNSAIQLFIIKNDLNFNWSIIFNLRCLKISFAALVSFALSHCLFQALSLSALGSLISKGAFIVTVYFSLLFLFGEKEAVRRILKRR